MTAPVSGQKKMGGRSARLGAAGGAGASEAGAVSEGGWGGSGGSGSAGAARADGPAAARNSSMASRRALPAGGYRWASGGRLPS